MLVEELDLQEAVLAGCCSGTGEVIRYLATYGQRRVRAAALLAPLPPFLPRSAANPDGADRDAYDDFLTELTADRPAAVKTYLDRHYNLDLLAVKPEGRPGSPAAHVRPDQGPGHGNNLGDSRSAV